MSTNGRLSRSALKPITRAADGTQVYLRADVADAFNAMNAESVRLFGVVLRATGGMSAYRTYAQQVKLRRAYENGTGNLAAQPGSSNHGWGLAIDLATPQMRAIVDRIGAKYGFAKRWSDAPSEWWHLKWRVGNYAAVRAARDPLAGYLDAERDAIRQYDDWKRRDVNEAGRKRLQAEMVALRKNVWRAAQKSGWDRARRRDRYRSLTARTT